MRWWPPVLHLAVVLTLVPVAALRIGGATGDPVTIPVTAEPVAEAEDIGPDDATVAVRKVDPAQLLRRPLFLPERRGVPGMGDTDPSAVSGADAEGVIRMTGFVADGTVPRAILSVGEGGPEEVVTEGMVFAGRTVRAIGRQSVELVGNGGKITVESFAQ